jgi:hypothetical protein
MKCSEKYPFQEMCDKAFPEKTPSVELHPVISIYAGPVKANLDVPFHETDYSECVELEEIMLK